MWTFPEPPAISMSLEAQDPMCLSICYAEIVHILPSQSSFESSQEEVIVMRPVAADVSEQADFRP